MRDGDASAVWADDDLGISMQLLRKRAEETRAHTVWSRRRRSTRRSDSIVGNDQRPVRPTDLEGDHHVTFISVGRKRMLQGIDNELGHEESDANGCRWQNGAAADQGVKLDRPIVADQGIRETFAQPRKVWTHFDGVTPPGSVKVLLDGRDRHDSPVRVDQVKPRLLRWSPF